MRDSSYKKTINHDDPTVAFHNTSAIEVDLGFSFSTALAGRLQCCLGDPKGHRVHALVLQLCDMVVVSWGAGQPPPGEINHR